MTDTTNEYAAYRGRGSLAQMVAELKRQVDARLDFVVDSRDLAVAVEDGRGLVLHGSPSAADFIPKEGFAFQRQALRQIGEKATPSIPPKFLDAAIEQSPSRIADYMTGVMHDHADRRLVRVLDGNVRAVLGESYRAIDNLDVVRVALEHAQENGAAVLEATLSDTVMRIKLAAPSIVETVERVRTDDSSGGWYAGGLGSKEFLSRVAANSRGDLPPFSSDPNAVHPLMTIGNSETGHGKFFARIGILQAVCFNLATVESVLAQVHLGQKLETGIFTRETIMAEAELIVRKARDTMRATFDPAKFRELIDRMRQTTTEQVHRPISAMEAAVKIGNLGTGRLDDLVAAFTREPGGMSIYNLGQAIARVGQDVADSDLAADFEDFAGAVLVGKHSRELVAAGA